MPSDLETRVWIREAWDLWGLEPLAYCKGETKPPGLCRSPTRCIQEPLGALREVQPGGLEGLKGGEAWSLLGCLQGGEAWSLLGALEEVKPGALGGLKRGEAWRSWGL